MADDCPPDPPPRLRRSWRPGWLASAFLCALVPWLVGQAARDVDWLTGLCFYIPSPVLAGLGLSAGLVQLLRRKARQATILALLTAAPIGWVLFVENQWIGPLKSGTASATAARRLVHWNIAYGAWGIAEIDRLLVRQKADIYVLSEVPRPYFLSEVASRLGPGYDSIRLGSMAFIVRGRIVAADRVVRSGGLKVNYVAWQTDRSARRLSLFGVDLTSDLLVARDPLLRHVRSLIERYRPDLVAGDFNAPRRSRALWPLPPGYAHAYLAAGRGWSYTWPVPYPLYAIDQCLVASTIAPLRYALVSSRHSDHRMQVLDFHLAPAGRGSARAPLGAGGNPALTRRSGQG